MSATRPPVAGPGSSATPSGLEHRIAGLLGAGSVASVILLAIGTLGFLTEGTSPLVTGWPHLDVGRLPADLVALRPTAFLWLGLMAAIATPLLRVGASLVGFLAVGERRMAAIAAAVLAVIAVAVAVASPWAA